MWVSPPNGKLFPSHNVCASLVSNLIKCKRISLSGFSKVQYKIYHWWLIRIFYLMPRWYLSFTHQMLTGASAFTIQSQKDCQKPLCTLFDTLLSVPSP